MNILTTYTLKYLRLNRKRTAVTILGVILSSALICGVFLLGVSFQKVMIDHEIFMAGNWHAQFHAVPYAKTQSITENSAVQTAMLSASLGSATDGSQNTVRPYLYVTAYDALSFQNHSIKLISGRFPQNGDELLISPVMIGDSGLSLKPGSTLQLAFGKRNIPDYDALVKAWGGEEYVALADGETFTPSVSKTYTVVGVMEPLPDETGMPAAFPALTYLDPAQLTATDKVNIAILARDQRVVHHGRGGCDRIGAERADMHEGAGRQLEILDHAPGDLACSRRAGVGTAAARGAAVAAERVAQQEQVGVVGHVATGRPEVDDRPGLGTDVAVGLHVGHHVVPQSALVTVGRLEVDVVDVLLELSDLLRCDRQPELRLGLGQRDPKPPPRAELPPRAPEGAHLGRAVSGNERVVVNQVRIGHDASFTRIGCCLTFDVLPRHGAPGRRTGPQPLRGW